VPAAAVIPAPIAYIQVVAVKKLVVETAQCQPGSPNSATRAGALIKSVCSMIFTGCACQYAQCLL
jgi:hypothetical protein